MILLTLATKKAFKLELHWLSDLIEYLSEFTIDNNLQQRKYVYHPMKTYLVIILHTNAQFRDAAKRQFLVIVVANNISSECKLT